MSKKQQQSNHIVGLQGTSVKGFDDYRNFVVNEFESESIFIRKKSSQGVYWVSLDKDLANQYFRDERWFFGLKYKDELRLIDHGILNEEELKVNKNVGFKR